MLVGGFAWNGPDGETERSVGLYFAKQHGLWYKLSLISEAETKQRPYGCAEHFPFYSQ